ncbi:MAG: addiction module killer protein [Acidobacteriia bacterium]|nr:addiction module killer protein [Terriglobia bacterium]
MDSRPGYRIYFGRYGETLIVLLGGATNRGQQGDIETAKGIWKDYPRRWQEE